MSRKNYSFLQMNGPAGSDDPLTKLIEGHACNIGKLMGNLHSFECLLRIFLTKHNKQTEDGFDAKIGTFVAITHLTSYDSLKELILKFNAIVKDKFPELELLSGVVHIRDAIAHGRFFTSHPSKPMQLFKYSKPQKGDRNVEVKFAVIMTPEWFVTELSAVLQEMAKVVEATRLMGFDLNLHSHG